MQEFDQSDLKKIHMPEPESHKGQNGKLLLVGGSHLFHAASLWALKIASRIVDMVFYASVPENNQIVQQAKEEFRDGIVISRSDIDSYAVEADCILIGPGMLRSEKSKIKYQKSKIQSLLEINELNDEGEQTYYLTRYLLEKFPHKKWVLDAGALQMMEPEWLKALNGNVVITPHPKEFLKLFGVEADLKTAEKMAREYNCIIVLKGPTDSVVSPEQTIEIADGNAGMTKGGTGDVLAGLIAALSCTNDLFLAAKVGSFLNKKAGDELYKTVGPFFNSSDLVDEIPRVMKQELL